MRAPKPILFNTEMVKAIMEKRKGATRRVADINPDIPCTYGEHEFVWDNFTGGKATGFVCRKCGFGVSPPHSHYPVGTSFIRPRYFSGDILYVRETWTRSMAGTYLYKATDNPIILDRWHPSIHMPKEAARLFLRVKDVGVERLQEISADECALEGVSLYSGPVGERETYYKAAFAKIWDSTIPKDKFPIDGWDANPWVWAYRFEQISKDEAQKGGEGNG